MRRFAQAIFALLILGLCVAPACAGERRILSTRHYRIHTDLEKALAEDLAKRMDAMYDEYARRLSNFKAPPESKKFDVYLFAKRADYLKLTGGKSNNTAGITIPALNVVAAFLEGQGR